MNKFLEMVLPKLFGGIIMFIILGFVAIIIKAIIIILFFT